MTRPDTIPLVPCARRVDGCARRGRGLRLWGMRGGAVAALLAACSAGLAQPPVPDSATPPKRDPTQPPPAGPLQGPLVSDVGLEPFEARPIREIVIRGLKKTDRGLVDNQIRSRAAAPLSVELARADVQRLVRLGKFREISVKVQPFDDGTVNLLFDVVETGTVTNVEAVGNRQVTDADIGAQVDILKDTPIDEFQIGAAVNRIQKLYRDKGYYQASVTVDQSELDERGVLLFRINEGDRVKVTDIRFEGNKAFTTRQISPAIKTNTAGLFDAGPVDNEVLDQDVAAITEFYKNRGYLDIRADRQVAFAPNGKEAIVTYLIDEGRLYTLRSVKVALLDNLGQPRTAKSGGMVPPVVFSREQIAGLMSIKAGDVYAFNKVRDSLDSIRNAYAQMGYVDARVAKAELRDEIRPEVDLLILLREGNPYLAGATVVKGNELTKSSVVLRDLHEIRPERPIDTSTKRVGERQVLDVEDRLNDRRLFEPGSIRMTVQPEKPEAPLYRDVLLELKETDTGSLGFGAGLSSDAGVTGTIRLNQRNFDVSDWPDSFGEFISGRAFRGGGQEFNLELSPGTETSSFVLSLTDPSAFDTEYSVGGSAFFRTREYDDFDERRYGATASVGRRFGTRWTGSMFFRYNDIEISDLQNDPTQDLLDVEGESVLTGLGVRLARTTVDTRFRPTKGTRIELSAERVGIFGGDYDFTRLNGSYQVFFAVDEDFFGRKTVLSLKTEIGYIPEGQDEAPLFERYYLGGRSMRGFRFRTVSPKGFDAAGNLTDDPVGGIWSFFFGPEIEKPLVDDFLAVVAFLDTGTVDEEVTFENYRVSVGFGVRLYISQLSPAPLAFDFGFPLLKQFGDEERVFSFSIDLPF